MRGTFWLPVMGWFWFCTEHRRLGGLLWDHRGARESLRRHVAKQHDVDGGEA